MKNLWLLPTDKPSKLYKNLLTDKLFILKNSIIDVSECNRKYQNIYITSNEEIKEGDWVYHPEVSQEYTKVNLLEEGDERYSKEYHTAQGVYKHKPTTNKWYKKERKITLTTDQDLIKDGVQAIDDEFLEWFIKNSSCEEVGIEKEHDDSVPYLKMRYCKPYKIIIPKKEPKQDWYCTKCGSYVSSESVTFKEVHQLCNTGVIIQETLEKVSKVKAFEFKVDYKPFETDLDYKDYAEYGFEKGFQIGAKLQAERMYSEKQMDDAYDKGFKDASQKMYSEEEVIELLRQRSIAMCTLSTRFQELRFKQDLEWFEKNKKK